MAWEENSRICLHMQLIAILSRIGVVLALASGKAECGQRRAFNAITADWKYDYRVAKLPLPHCGNRSTTLR